MPPLPKYDPCPLLDLPPELRLRIYDHLYTDQQQCILEQENQIKCYQIGKCPSVANLLLTCRQLYNEVLPIVYTMTIFKMVVFGNRTPSNGYEEQFLTPRDSRMILKHVRRLEVVIHIMELGDLDLAIERVITISRQIPQDRKLDTCLVTFAYYPSDIFNPYPMMKILSEATFAKVRHLDQRVFLSTAERQVSICLKNEAMRKVQRHAQIP